MRRRLGGPIWRAPTIASSARTLCRFCVAPGANPLAALDENLAATIWL